MKENSIEENIKKIENLIECFRKAEIVELKDIESIYQKCSYSDYKAIDHILSDYKRVLKENEELKSNNEKYTIHLTDKQYNAVIEKAQNDINQKWIQKVKDKIEEEKLPLTIVGGRKNKKTLEYGIKLGRRQALQELIEEREEK